MKCTNPVDSVVLADYWLTAREQSDRAMFRHAGGLFSHDAQRDPGWSKVFAKMNVVQPWTVSDVDLDEQLEISGKTRTRSMHGSTNRFPGR